MRPMLLLQKQKRPHMNPTLPTHRITYKEAFVILDLGGHPRRLLAAVHPDRHPEARRDEATAAFARVVLAREVRGGRVSEVSFED